MSKELLAIMEQLKREKGISKKTIFDAIKQALTVAAKKIAKITSPGADVKVEIDEEKLDIHVYIGGKEIVSQEFGRIAAQTARQVIIQKIREAEKDNLYKEFKNKEGDIIGGTVYRIENKAIIIDLLGKAEGILPKSLLSPLDRFKIGDRVKSYICEVKREGGTQIILSRRHEGLVKKLFELEVPEIYEGIVEIKSLARVPGERTKIAVFSKDDKVDPVGACVGVRGARVSNIREELRGEKLDIVRWSDDIREFIKNALAPAIIAKIELDRDNRRVKVLVSKEQLSLAIGKRGQNVRLASKLVGWEIDVRSKETLEEEVAKISSLNSVGKKTAKVLVDAGYETIDDIANADPKEIAGLKGIGKRRAINIVKEAKKKVSYMESEKEKN